MGLSIVRFSRSETETAEWGVMVGDQVNPLLLQAIDHREIMQAYIDDPSALRSAQSIEALHRDELCFHAPVSKDIQIFCQGLNYADHRKEAGQSSAAQSEESLIFMKAASSICGPNDSIIRPKGCVLLDYEIELALVMKRDLPPGICVREDDLSEFVGAMLLVNDVSARDMMFGAPMLQWFKGKSQRTFCPAGPVLYLMDKDDFSRLYDMGLTLKLNNTIKQHSTTELLIHKPAKTLTELAAFTDVMRGDLLLTGTPGGVLAEANLRGALAILLNMKNDERRRAKFTQAQLANAAFLEPGDVLDLEIKSRDGHIDLGRQRNTIVSV